MFEISQKRLVINILKNVRCSMKAKPFGILRNVIIDKTAYKQYTHEYYRECSSLVNSIIKITHILIYYYLRSEVIACLARCLFIFV